ncbi:MAG: efflux RND transporter permease subunit [Candidatus Zixiibacteriota bacterium]
MYKLARFSVQYPTTILMVVLAVLLLGYISFTRLGVDLLPDLNSPRLFMEISAGERPPEEIEDQFVSQLEAVAARGRKVQNVSSISRVGRALITIEYAWDADMDEAFLDLQKAVADYSQASDVDEISVSQHDPNAVPIVTAIFSHPEFKDLDKLRQTAENNISNELIRLPGVAEVDIIGGRRRAVEIKTDAYTLEAYGITLDLLAGQIMSSNRNMTGGSIVEMGKRYIIRGVGEFYDKDDIENLIVAYKSPEGTQAANTADRVPIYLREVASIEFGLDEPENIVRLNGQKCLALEVYKEARYNTIDAAAAALDRLAELSTALPGYELTIIQDQAHFIRAAVTEVEQTGIIGIILAIIILYVFLRRIGITAVISFAIPISIVATFNLMYFNDLSLNIMTLGGLALGAGMLVDNAIVVVENIFRHLEDGKSLKDAAIYGAGEVGGAITSSTLTTIIVFLPIVYLHGAAGELFREQAWTVAYSLISSLFVALAVIPMLCSRLLKKRQTYTVKHTITFPGYGRLLEKIIARRVRIIAGGFVLVIIAVILIPITGSEFMPHANQGELSINLALPEGTSLERTEGAVRNIENILKEQFKNNINHIYSRVGPGGAGNLEIDALADENNAIIHILLNPEAANSSEKIIEGINQILAGLPDIEARLIVEQTALRSTLGTESEPIVIEIKGQDLDLLEQLADTVQQRVMAISELKNVETSFQEGRPEINLRINRTMASEFGLTPQSIGSQLKDALSGRDAGQINHQGEYTDIKLLRADITLSELEGLLLETSSGRRVRVDEIAYIEQTYSPREIIRNNQIRIARITAHITNDISFDRIAVKVKESLNTIALPPEYSIAVTGEEQLRQEAFGNLKFALLLAIILVYMVMASQFESLLHPFVILLTIPLAGVGAVFILFILNMPFNVMSFIGIIMLAGIAVNDSIILIDRINQNRRSGLELIPAITNAGQTRIRPIIMTSITTILALLPLTIGIGEGASLRAPMAIAVIGGLFTSTALTLIVIPAVYYMLAGKVSTIDLKSEHKAT